MLVFFKNFWLISDFFWKSKKGIIALLVLFISILLEFFGVYISVQINSWNVDFYNSIQNYDKALLIKQLITFIILISFMMTNYFITYFIGQFFIIYVRKPLTEFYTKNWLYTKCYMKNSNNFDNPEERMDYDIEQFVRVSKFLFLGIVRNVSSFLSFSIVLWGLSGNLNFSVAGVEITIYGYLFWLAVIFGVVNVWMVFKVGSPLKQLIYDKQKFEASFRYHLSTIRNNKSAISDNKSEKYEYLESRKNFTNIVTNFYGVTFRSAKINIVSMLFYQIYSIMGTVLSLPRYFSKELSFGQMMQVNSALMQVIYPIIYLANIYEYIAELRASVSRLSELKKNIDKSDRSHNKNIQINSGQSYFLTLEDVTVLLNDRWLFSKISLNMCIGDSVFIHGENGVGKTSLLRVINGQNHSFEGDVIFNKYPRILFLIAKPYYPEDDFKRAMFYPSLSSIPSDERFIKILSELGLSYLDKFINTRHDWRNLLSSGEQQRLAFCRLFVKNYDLVLLDEATSNISNEAEKNIYKLLQDKKLTYISINHNHRIKEYHQLFIELKF